jgi:phosphate-selective porin OprO/OprP
MKDRIGRMDGYSATNPFWEKVIVHYLPNDLFRILVFGILMGFHTHSANAQDVQGTNPTAVVVGADANGFFLRSADGSYQLRIAGLLQADGRFFLSRQVEPSTFLIRRLRPTFQGTLARYIDFRIVPDFGDGRTVLQDANLDIRFWQTAVLRFGKFKPPFGLERLQSSSDLTFIERALPSALAPNRDEGIQIFGDIEGGTFSYAVAVTNGVPDGANADIDNNDGKDFVGRVFFLPFQQDSPENFLRGLGVGFAVSSGEQEGQLLPVYRTSAQSIFFSYLVGSSASGRRDRYSPQAYFYNGPFGLMAEYISSAQEVSRAGVEDTIRNDAWQLSASWFITGEDKSYRSTPPRTPLDPRTGGGGAVELAGRFSELSVDTSAFDQGFADSSRSARRAQEWMFGANWYLNRHTKFVVDFERTVFLGGASQSDRAAETAVLSRLQISF